MEDVRLSSDEAEPQPQLQSQPQQSPSPSPAADSPRPQSVLAPIETPVAPATPSKVGFAPIVTVVGFHHARGPEVENWFGTEDGFDPAVEFGWSNLPFMALSDGAHA